MIMLVGLLN